MARAAQEAEASAKAAAARCRALHTEEQTCETLSKSSLNLQLWVLMLLLPRWCKAF